MPIRQLSRLCVHGLVSLLLAATAVAQQPAADSPALASMKKDAIAGVESRTKLAQVMVDTVFSYSELGYQEFHSSKYLSDLLESNGFKVERGIAGIPTAFMATWGSGKPVIALGSDVDCIPQASQKPGVAYKDPIVTGAPGHGEGHNSGIPLNILAVLAVKDIMVKNHMSGTLKVWPGIAEELLGAKAYYVRAGYFKDVDAVLFAHVANNLAVGYGGFSTLGAVSIRYEFTDPLLTLQLRLGPKDSRLEEVTKGSV